MPASVLESEALCIENLISTSFDNYQKNIHDTPLKPAHKKKANRSSLLFDSSTKSANQLRNQIHQFLKQHEEEDAIESISEALTKILEMTLANIVSAQVITYNSFKSSHVHDAAMKILDMIASFAFSKGNGTFSQVVLEFWTSFLSVDVEAVRGVAVEMLKMSIMYLYSYKPLQSKNLQKQQKRQVLFESAPFLYGTLDNVDTEIVWRESCLVDIKELLSDRLLDKSQAVRMLAIQACRKIFHSPDEDFLGLTNPELHEDLTLELLWNLEHDPSFQNRAEAIQAVPITSDTLSAIVSRTRDSKLKVRVDALDLLSQKVDVKILSRKQRIDILQSGLSMRYPTTYQAATKMLCCGWMKSCKFDPIQLLQLLENIDSKSDYDQENLDIYEDVCVQAIRAIIAAASDDYVSGTIEATGNSPDGSPATTMSTSETTLAELSAPEIREYKENVLDLKKFDMKAMYEHIHTKEQSNMDEGEDEQEDNVLNPVSILYIRTMCDTILESKTLSDYKKSSLVAEIVPDITILGAAIEYHSEKMNAYGEQVDHLEDDEKEQDKLSYYEEKEETEVFICLHLLKLAKVVDLKEEGTRRHFSSIIHRILSNPDTNADLMEGAVVALSASSESEASFLLAISEVLSYIVESEADKSTNNEDDSSPRLSSDMNPEQRKDQHLRGMEILTVALENVSRRMSANQILKNFASLIVEPLTDISLGAVVREAAVGCVGRYVLLMDEESVINDYKPLIMDIAYSKDENIEIRAQALLILCDLAFLFHRILAPIKLDKVGENEITLSDLLLAMLSQPKKALAIVAAECATKLSFTGKIHDTKIIGHLLSMYFDKDLEQSGHEGDDVAKEVGSPARLAQLLTIYFPAYSLSSDIARATLAASFRPVLDTVLKKMTTKVRGRKATTWPVGKMVGYLCQIIDQGEVEASEEKSNSEIKKISPVLHAAIAISEFVSDEYDNINVTFLRAITKILSKSYIDVEIENMDALKKLKSNLNQLTLEITDTSALRNVEILFEIVDEVQSEDERSEDEEDDESAPEESDHKMENTMEIEDDEDSAPGEHVQDIEDTKEAEDDEEEGMVQEQEQSIQGASVFENLGEVEDNSAPKRTSKSSSSRVGKTTLPVFASLGETERQSRRARSNVIPTFATLGGENNDEDSFESESSASSYESSDEFSE